ncbi:MAG: plasmid mobilization relaxosome protein MobC [Chitinophagaceae bacterium]|nr:MAG: plasmid mobilization relaxosome protein MobC [Chitinophagaceae bacterium]
MERQKNNKTRWINIRLHPEQYDIIYQKFKATTCRKLSEYARRVLLDKAVTVYTRNQSLDDFMAEMIRLRNELSAIGNNYNQVVKRLHTLTDFQSIQQWLLLNEKSKQILLQKVDEIKLKINSISDKWLV